jgi:glycosyltransferase involved in cell wall biosynthesis
MVPSTWLETGPLVVLEAFAAGVPVLGSDLGGIAEWVIDGVNGLLFKPADPSAWADGMTRYVMKPELRQILKSKVVKPNGMDRVASAVAEEYDNAISSQIH